MKQCPITCPLLLSFYWRIFICFNYSLDVADFTSYANTQLKDRFCTINMELFFSNSSTVDFWLSVSLLYCVFFLLTGEEFLASYWNNKAKQALFTALNVKPNLHQAKNSILFLGDGACENQLSCFSSHSLKYGLFFKLKKKTTILFIWK